MSSNSNNNNKKGELRFLCKLCSKNVSGNNDAILCDLCQTQVQQPNVNVLTILNKNICEVVMSHGIASLVSIHSFRLVI